MTSEPEKLLPCPFCGDTDIRRGAERDVDGNPDSWFVTTCDTCGAELNGRTQEIADERWNTRLSSPVSGADMVMVPREPTKAMLSAAVNAEKGEGRTMSQLLREVYAAMLSASPTPPIPVIAEAGERERIAPSSLTSTTLYREIDALGGTGGGDWHEGYSAALTDVLEILSRRGFTQQKDTGQ